MDDFFHYYFNFHYWALAFPALLKGAFVTLQLAAITIVCGLSLGLALAVVRALGMRGPNCLIVVFVDVFRALPPLVVLFMLYFALPYGGIRLSAFLCAVITLVANLAAVAEEVFWAGILSVPRGQWEAARSTGLSKLGVLRSVVIPQGVRVSIPPLTNKMISITKNTALASVVAVPELLNQMSTEQGVHANPSPLMLGAIMFLLIFAPLVQATRWIERRFQWVRY